MKWIVYTPDNPPKLPPRTGTRYPYRGPYYWAAPYVLRNWSYFWSQMIRYAIANPTRPLWATCNVSRTVNGESQHTRYWSAWNWRKGTWGRWRKGTPKVFTG